MKPGGRVPGAGSHRTRPVTEYVPRPVGLPVGLNVCQVPPPVTALDVSSSPAGGTKRSRPVTVLDRRTDRQVQALLPAEQSTARQFSGEIGPAEGTARSATTSLRA